MQAGKAGLLERWAILQPLGNADFVRLWLASGIWWQAMWMEQLVLGWLTLEMTDSPWLVALLGFYRSIPLLFLGLFSSLITDRFKRRNLILVFQSVNTGCLVLIAILFWMENLEFWHLAAVSLVNGTSWALDWPTRRAILPDLVGKGKVVDAMWLENVLSSLTRISGPLGAGVFLETIGIGGTLNILGFMGVGAILILAGIKSQTRAPQHPQGLRAIGAQVLEGINYVRASKRIYITGALEGSEDALTRFGLLFGLSLLYISAFFTLGLMISTLTHRTSTALLVALLIWICWILVVPNLAPIAARLLTPVPSQQVIDAEKQAIERESQVLLESIQKRKVYGDRDEFERIREDAEKRQNKLDKFFRDKLKAQIGLTQNLARISPSASYLFASTRLAGTGPDLFATFQKAHERFQQSQQEYQNDLFRSDKIEWDRSGPKANDPEWFRADDLPRFEMKAERLNDSFNAALFDILLLVIYNVIFFMLSYVFFLRYDVT